MQCGAKRSTCADCHGVSTTAPWHRDHAFADLCAACHEGQPEAKDATEAHRGLADPRASCQRCHAANVSYTAATAEPPPPPIEAHGRAGANLAAVVLAAALGVAIVVGWRRG